MAHFRYDREALTAWLIGAKPSEKLRLYLNGRLVRVQTGLAMLPSATGAAYMGSTSVDRVAQLLNQALSRLATPSGKLIVEYADQLYMEDVSEDNRPTVTPVRGNEFGEAGLPIVFYELTLMTTH